MNSTLQFPGSLYVSGDINPFPFLKDMRGSCNNNYISNESLRSHKE